MPAGSAKAFLISLFHTIPKESALGVETELAERERIQLDTAEKINFGYV